MGLSGVVAWIFPAPRFRRPQRAGRGSGYRRNHNICLAAAFLVLGGVLGGCAETEFLSQAFKQIKPGDKSEGRYKVGDPYQVEGVWYYPNVDYTYDETGIASWYGADFHNKKTANGEIYDMNAVSAAHKTLPMPSLVQVTNLENGRAINVRINDRGPFVNGRIIDLSRRAAQLLGMEKKGTAKVRVQIMADESQQMAMGNSVPESLQKAALEKAPVETVGVESAPRESVVAEKLPPPEGGTAAPVKEATPKTAVPTEKTVKPVEIKTAEAREPEVRYGSTGPSNLYIQAGAFSDSNNAYRLKMDLSKLGPANITQTQSGKQKFFRVRLGPISSVEEADKMLNNVLKAGHKDARLVVDN